ncbi:MAG: hypothetical protein RLZZ196_54, partial [Bacteroidota bacterium]
MHDYFYHLHLPRTGGTHFRHNMMPSLIPYFKNNKVNIHEISETDTAHWCWFEPIINESTYIFSSFRDPAERLVSQFVRQAQKAISQGQTSYSKYDINKINFYKWIEKNPEMYKNIQAKSLVYYNKDHSIYKPSTGVKWEFDKTPIRDHYMFDKDFVNFQIN